MPNFTQNRYPWHQARSNIHTCSSYCQGYVAICYRMLEPQLCISNCALERGRLTLGKLLVVFVFGLYYLSSRFLESCWLYGTTTTFRTCVGYAFFDIGRRALRRTTHLVVRLHYHYVNQNHDCDDCGYCGAALNERKITTPRSIWHLPASMK